METNKHKLHLKNSIIKGILNFLPQTHLRKIRQIKNKKIFNYYIKRRKKVRIYKHRYYINITIIGKLITDKKLYKSWNEDFDVPEFDEDMLIDELTYKMENGKIEDGGYVIDFHSSSVFPEEWIQAVVLLRCNNTTLYDRLKERG